MRKLRNFFNPARILGLILILITVCGLLYIRSNVGTIMMVDGESMMPYHHDRDFVIVTVVKDPSELQVGDVIVATVEGRRLVKRIQATPGGTTVLNPEKRVPAVTMKENEYYITGDNYQNSYDSRYFGPITGDQILYKCTTIRWSFWGSIIAVFIPAVLAMYCLAFIYVPSDLNLDNIVIEENVEVPQ